MARGPRPALQYRSKKSLVCAAPGCGKTSSYSFFVSPKSLVNAAKKAHGLSRRPSIHLLLDSRICLACYKLCCRRYTSPDVSAARARAVYRARQTELPPPRPLAARTRTAMERTANALPGSAAAAAATVATIDAIVGSTAPCFATEPAIATVASAAGSPVSAAARSSTAHAIASASSTFKSAVSPTASKPTAAAAISAAAALAAHSASIDTPTFGCCEYHALARKVLFENEFGWFPVAAEFTVEPRRYRDYADGGTFLASIMWDDDAVHMSGPDIHYMIDSTDRVMITADSLSLFWFWRSARTSRELGALLTCDFSGVQFPFADSKLVNAKMRSFKMNCCF
jgi:hypothetical protein